ncbi:hypothetical protein KCV04_g33, partial [Aureobasidium melanogenum]
MAAHYEGVAIADNITGHAHRTPELHLPNQWNLGAEGISWAASSLGALPFLASFSAVSSTTLEQKLSVVR